MRTGVWPTGVSTVAVTTILLMLVAAPATVFIMNGGSSWLWGSKAPATEVEVHIPLPEPELQSPEWYQVAKSAAAAALQCGQEDPEWLCTAKEWLLT